MYPILNIALEFIFPECASDHMLLLLEILTLGIKFKILHMTN